MRLQLKWKCPSRVAEAARQCCLCDIPMLWGQGMALQGRHSPSSTSLHRAGVGQGDYSWVIVCHCSVCEAPRTSSCLLILLCAREATEHSQRKGKGGAPLLASPGTHRG